MAVPVAVPMAMIVVIMVVRGVVVVVVGHGEIGKLISDQWL